MYGPPGAAYVYLVYGMYDCLNVVVEPDRSPAAVLVRAVAPLEGLPAMRDARVALLARRVRDPGRVAAEAERVARLAPDRLAAGPGLVAAAFAIDRSDTGVDLCDPASTLRLEPGRAEGAPQTVVATPRIGIDYAAEPWRSAPWRFALAGHPSVSRRVRA